MKALFSFRLPVINPTPRSFWSLWSLLVLWLGLALAARAQEVPPRPEPPRLVNDFAHVMQPQEADALEQKLVAYDDSTSSQIAVVTVPTLGGSDIFSYAQKLYESWGIGRKGKNNGLLVLVAIQEHQVRIHTGYGLEGAVPDALAKRITANTMVPAFRNNQYYAGLDRGTDELISLAKGEYQADPADAQRNQGSRDHSGSGAGFWIIIAVLVLIFLLRSRGGGGRGGRGGFSGGFMPPIIFGDFSGGRGVFGGGGGSGGGGFGGFGGGSSGGGGASSSW